jgi:hypothetical protein
VAFLAAALFLRLQNGFSRAGLDAATVIRPALAAIKRF